MEPKRVYLDDRAEDSASIIIEAGYASSLSGAVRIALGQFAAAVHGRPPMVTPTTP